MGRLILQMIQSTGPILSTKAIEISPSYLLDTKMQTGCLHSGALCDTDHDNKKHMYALSHVISYS